jgi:hypothetical protein
MGPIPELKANALEWTRIKRAFCQNGGGSLEPKAKALEGTYVFGAYPREPSPMESQCPRMHLEGVRAISVKPSFPEWSTIIPRSSGDLAEAKTLGLRESTYYERHTRPHALPYAISNNINSCPHSLPASLAYTSKLCHPKFSK